MLRIAARPLLQIAQLVQMERLAFRDQLLPLGFQLEEKNNENYYIKISKNESIE